MLCAICEGKEGTRNFHGLLICEECLEAEMKAQKEDRISIAKLGL